MTCVTSNSEAAKHPTRLHLGILFKGKHLTNTLRKLDLPRDFVFHTDLGPKGSYRLEHVLRYLEKFLAPWTEERAKARDYNILYIDSY